MSEANPLRQAAGYLAYLKRESSRGTPEQLRDAERNLLFLRTKRTLTDAVNSGLLVKEDRFQLASILLGYAPRPRKRRG